MPARSIGSGTVSFGLVSIPVKLYTTRNSGSRLSFNMVHADCGTRLKQQMVCPKCEVVVDRSQVLKGYEFSKGQYVVLTADEYKALEAVSNNAIELAEFVPADQVDPVLYDSSYYLGPDKGGERAYALLGEAMTRTGLVGVARYSSRGKQYLVVVRPYDDGGLILHQLRYADEVKAFSEVPLDEPASGSPAELELAVQIIEQIASDEFHPENYTDEVKARVLELINQKIEGQEITAAPEAPQAQVIDLMDALKQSLGEAGTSTKGSKKAKATSSKGRKAAKSSTKQASSKSKKKKASGG